MNEWVTFGTLHAVSEGRDGVAGLDGHVAHGDHWSGVVFGVDQVNGRGGCAEAGIQDRLVDVVAVHALPTELGQRSWVCVDDLTCERGECSRPDLSQVPGQNDQIDPALEQRLTHRIIKTGWVKRVSIKKEMLDTNRVRVLGHRRIGFGGYQQRNRASKPSRSAALSEMPECASRTRRANREPRSANFAIFHSPNVRKPSRRTRQPHPQSSRQRHLSDRSERRAMRGKRATSRLFLW